MIGCMRKRTDSRIEAACGLLEKMIERCANCQGRGDVRALSVAGTKLVPCSACAGLRGVLAVLTGPTEEPEVTVGSGNAFADLGVADPEEALRKADLARAIGLIIEARDLNQTQAAEVLGIERAEVFFLLRGRLRGFSIERLRSVLAVLTQKSPPAGG